MRPRVSIVVPAYNSEAYLANTLDSVLAQSFNDWELIVYDDGSTDGTGLICDQYASSDPRIRAIHGANVGVAEARNAGYAASDPNSEFVIFLDNDDVWVPDALETLVAILDENSAFVSSHSVARCIDENGDQPPLDDLEDRMRDRLGFRGRDVVALMPHEPTTFADLAYANWIVTPGLHLMRRASLNAVGVFDPATVPCDDYDLSVRLSRRGPIGFTSRSLLHWRRHPEAQSYQSSNWSLAVLEVLHKMLNDPTNTSAQKRVARRGYMHQISVANGATREHLANREFSRALRSGLRAARIGAFYARSRAFGLRRR
jgi:glycosyltransferase involved in cell wall biosynthesis